MKVSAKSLHAALNARLYCYYGGGGGDDSPPDPGAVFIESLLKRVYTQRAMEDAPLTKVEMTDEDATRLADVLRDVTLDHIDLLAPIDRQAFIRLRHLADKVAAGAVGGDYEGT